jgi:hypothetical protein
MVNTDVHSLPFPQDSCFLPPPNEPVAVALSVQKRLYEDVGWAAIFQQGKQCAVLKGEESTQSLDAVC